MRFLGKKSPKVVAVAGIAFAILALGACSGGGGSLSGSAPLQQQPVTPTAGTLSLPLPQAGVSNAALPGVGGFTETISFPANNAPSGTKLALTVSSRAPSAMPALDPAMHVAIPFLYFTLIANNDVRLNGFPGFKLAMPAGFNIGSLPVKIGFYDPVSGWTYVGNFGVLGRTATFTPTASPVMLKAGVTYYALPYTCSCTPVSCGPSPSPSPSPSGISTTVPLAVATQLPIPALGGFSGDWVAAANNAPAGTTVTLTSYASAPPGAPTPASDSRRPLFVRPPVNGIHYVSFHYSKSGSNSVTAASGSSDITFTKFPAVAMGLPAGFNTSGLTFKLETFDFTTGALIDTEIGAISGASPIEVSFPGTDSPFSAVAGHTYLWELVTESVALYVTNLNNNTITVYDQNGNQLTPSGTFPNLDGPSGVVFDSSNANLYVTNHNNNTITEYDLNGNQITPSGTFPNLSRPFDIAFDSSNGHLYVPNFGNNTMTVYDQNGNQITLSGTFPNLRGPFGIAFDSSSSHLYVGNISNNTITEYDQNGNQITPSGTFPNLYDPRAVTFDSSNNRLYVGNFGFPVNNGTIMVYDQNGNQITTSGTFPNVHNPIGIAFDLLNSHLYAANDGNDTMTVYDQNGNQLFTSGTFPGLDGPNHLITVP
jgi:DNA-binding beta-propeller fold protein YncE